MSSLNSFYTVVSDGTVVNSLAALTGDVTAAQIAAALNLLAGNDRINYDSLQNTPTIPTSINLSSNTETLTGNKTLTAESEYYQTLNPNGANRTITLHPDWSGLITNDSDGANSLIISDGVSTILSMSADSNVKSILAWNDGVNYYLIQQSSFEATTAQLTVYYADIVGSARDSADLANELSTIESALATKVDAVPFGGFIESIQDKTYPLFKPDRSYIIKSLRVKSSAGTCTWAVQINGFSVTGLGAVSVSSTEQLITATGSNTVAAGQGVTILSSANSGATDVEFTLMLEAV